MVDRDKIARMRHFCCNRVLMSLLIKTRRSLTVVKQS